MSERKGFPRTYRFSGETIRKLIEIHEKRNFPSQTLALETIIAEAYDSLQIPLQPQKKPSTLDLMLKEVLGDDLSKRHIEFLEKRRKQDQSLEDVFRNFLDDKGINLTTKEFIDRIHAEKIDHFYVGKPEPCEYRAIDPEKKKWYCGGKLIPSVVCVAKQKRQLEKGYGCNPLL